MNRPRLHSVRTLAAARPVATARAGVTLTEVLMSLLVMGLGITSVFTLFPMSVLRSVKSTNLTNATLLSQSARDLFVSNKSTLLLPPTRATFAPNASSHGKDWALLGTPAATFGPSVPDASIPDPFIGTFVVDPFGARSAPGYGATSGKFGEQTPGSTTAPWGVLRVAGYLNSGGGVPSPLINDNVSANDSWVTAFEEFPAANPTAVAGPPATHDIPFSGVDLNTAASSQSRVLILSADRKRSLIRSLHPTSPVPTSSSIRLASALPDDMDEATEISTVRLQNYERRYTWLLTVHRDRYGGSTGQLAVFFRRGFGESEQLYPVTVNVGSDIYGRRVQGEVISVANYTSGVPKPGDYIFGTWIETSGGQTQHHGRWYRILRVIDRTGGNYDITLDRRWVGKTQGSNQPSVMFLNGVVSVFDL